MSYLIDEEDIPNTIDDLSEQIGIRYRKIGGMVSPLFVKKIRDQIARINVRLRSEVMKKKIMLEDVRYVIEE